MERCRRVPRREVRGAEKCRAVPLCREVLRCRGAEWCRGGVRRCGAARVEMRKRGPSTGPCASTVGVRGSRVQGPTVSIVHAFGRRRRACVDTESYG